jgi:hypothetical protein
MNLKKTLVACALIAAATLPGLSQAASVTFDFTSGGVVTGSGNGNSIEFTGSDGTTKVTVRAVGFTGAGNTSQSATVTSLDSLGLGVCNRSETTCGANQRGGAADNVGSNEYLLFSFNSEVDVASFGLNLAARPGVPTFADADAVHFVFSDTFFATGSVLNDLLIAFGPGQESSSSVLPRTVNDTNPGQFDSLIIMANSVSSNEDGFRVSGLSANVPLPGTLALIGIAGLAGMAARKRKAA